jgi:hypothetical protein
MSSVWGTAPKDEKQVKNYWDNKEIASIPSINTISDTGTNIIVPPISYVGHQVADLDILNQKLVLPTKTEGGIDVSLLTSVVKPVDVVYEQDELWDYQHLIIEIAQIIRNSKDEPVKTVEETENFEDFDVMPFEENVS